jgi:hypothetical protein
MAVGSHWDWKKGDKGGRVRTEFRTNQMLTLGDAQISKQSYVEAKHLRATTTRTTFVRDHLEVNESARTFENKQASLYYIYPMTKITMATPPKLPSTHYLVPLADSLIPSEYVI